MKREEKANVWRVEPEWSSLSASRHLFSQCQGHVLMGLWTVVRSALAKTWVGAVFSSGSRSSLRPAAVAGAEDPLPLAQILLSSSPPPLLQSGTQPGLPFSPPCSGPSNTEGSSGWV